MAAGVIRDVQAMTHVVGMEMRLRCSQALMNIGRLVLFEVTETLQE
jgi:hypothetical protein